MESAFSHQVRTIECSNCGAPITGGVSGGAAECAYCGAAVVITGRPMEHRQATQIDEAARLAGLWHQFKGYSPSDGMLRPPDGLGTFTQMLRDPATQAAGAEGYRQEWEKTRRQLQATPSDPSTQTHLFRIAVRLADHYERTADQARARAVLETAIDAVLDANQRDVLRCRLARAALRQGDLTAGAAWLEEVNPRPMVIELDTERRLAAALLALQRGDLAEVQRLVGEMPGQVPMVAADRLLPGTLRAHAMAGLGRMEQAQRQVGALAQIGGLSEVRRVFSEARGPASAWAEQVAARLLRRRRFVGRLFGSLVIAAIVLPITCGIFTPMGMTCVSGSYQAVIRCLEQHPQASAALGSDLAWRFGSNCRDKGGCGGSHLKWRLPVKGSRAQGTFSFSGSRLDGGWTISGFLRVEGRSIQVICEPRW